MRIVVLMSLLLCLIPIKSQVKVFGNIEFGFTRKEVKEILLKEKELKNCGNKIRLTMMDTEYIMDIKYSNKKMVSLEIYNADVVYASQSVNYFADDFFDTDSVLFLNLIRNSYGDADIITNNNHMISDTIILQYKWELIDKQIMILNNYTNGVKYPSMVIKSDQSADRILVENLR